MIKITKLEAENIKRVRAVELTPAPNGLTVIGGRNGQGKTSVLDAILWGLGGDRYRPSKPQRDGSVLPPHIRIELSNGIVVERKGKNSELRVSDPSGRRAGQQLLNSFVEQFALDMPQFMQASGKEKAQTLLRIIGVEQELAKMDRLEGELYSQRTVVGRIADQKAKYARELPHYDGAPPDLVSASELIRKQQEILLRNADNQRKRQRVQEIERQVQELEAQMQRLERQLEQAQKDLRIAHASADDLEDQSTAELERSIEQIDAVNVRVRANLERMRAEEDAQEYGRQYAALTVQIDQVRNQRKALLDHANMPLEGLTVENGELIYKGAQWDCMSGAEQLCVATAIVRRLNPQCGFVLLDKLEQMDTDTLRAFGDWLEREGLQAIATRVSTGDECTLLIEDGTMAGERFTEAEQAAQQAPADWKGGF